MALWTDVIDPATLTGYARRSLAEYESNQGTLARWLPNRDVADVVVRFVAGSTGLVEAAKWRAYDAEPEIGRRTTARRVLAELQAVSQNIPISEYEQLRMRSGTVPDESALITIQNTVDAVVRSISDAVEKLRGTVLATGKAIIDQDNYKVTDDFNRSASHQVVAPTLWSNTGTSRLSYLTDLTDVYRGTTGTDPGSLVMSRRVFRALVAGTEFQTQLLNGGARQATAQEVQNIVTGAGLPPIVQYDRQVAANGVRASALPDDMLLMLPAPVEPDDWQGTDLGATFWGRTLTSSDPAWSIPDLDQPGIVAGVWKNDKPPMGLELISDAIALPVLANADRSLAARVL